MTAIAGNENEKNWCSEYMRNALQNRVLAFNVKHSWLNRGLINENTTFGDVRSNDQLMKLVSNYLSCGLSDINSDDNFSVGVMSDFKLYGASVSVLEQACVGNPERLDVAVKGRNRLLKLVKKIREKMILDMDFDGTDEAVEEKKADDKAKREAAKAAKAAKALEKALNDTPDKRKQQTEEGITNLIDEEAEESDGEDIEEVSEPSNRTATSSMKKSELIRELEEAKKEIKELGSKVAAKTKRVELGVLSSKNDTDFYVEMPSVVYALERTLKASPKVKVILDPCCGTGFKIATTECLRSMGYTVLAYDKAAFFENRRRDYLKQDVIEEYDLMVTFPPIRLKFQFLKRALTIGKPFLMLLPAKILSHSASVELLKTYGLNVGVLVPMPKFISSIDKKVKVVGDMLWVSYGGVQHSKASINLTFIPHNVLLNVAVMPEEDDGDEASALLDLHEVYKESEKVDGENPNDDAGDMNVDDNISTLTGESSKRKTGEHLSWDSLKRIDDKNTPEIYTFPPDDTIYEDDTESVFKNCKDPYDDTINKDNDKVVPKKSEKRPIINTLNP